MSGRQERAAKRELLVDAAADVLRASGVAGCTARGIAERAGLSKSAIHYYFEEVEQLVDLGWQRLMGQFIDLMEKSAAAEGDPVESLWAAARLYLRLGTSRDRRIPMMPFEFLVFASRNDRLDAVEPVMDEIADLFGRLLADAACDDVHRKAEVFVFALIGILVRAEITPLDVEQAFAHLADVVGVPPPAPR